MREDILEVHVETTWVCDESGDLLTSNEPSPAYRQPAPAHLLTWSADRWHHRFRPDIPSSARQSLTDLATAHWPFHDRLAPIPIDEIRGILKPHADVSKVVAGPAFVIPDTQMGLNAVAITPKNAHLCCEMSPSVVDDVIDEQPCFAVFLDGKAVSICTTVRRSPHAAEAGLDTHEDHRGKGYALEVTSAWAKATRQQGRLPLYSTSWDNAASQRVAEKLNAIHYACDFRLQ